MKDHVSLQERLKDLRVEKGLKLEELAEKTGISKSALASYENEENRNKEINHPRSLRKKDSSNFRFLLILGMVPPIIENPPISAVTVEMGG